MLLRDVELVALAGAKRLNRGITHDEVSELLSMVETGRGLSRVAKKLRLAKQYVKVMRNDKPPELTEDFELQWESKQQEGCSRLDMRDLKRLAPNLTSMCLPYLQYVPMRLASNVLLADLAHTGGTGDLVLAYWKLGLLESKELFLERVSLISNWCKLRVAVLPAGVKREWMLEAQSLAGVRYPDENSNKETSDALRKTAGADSVPDEPMRSIYLQGAKTQQMRSKAGMTLPQYVESLRWKTPGSASMAGLSSLDVQVSDTEFSVRVTKALVPYMMTAEELTEAVQRVKTLHSVIVKTVIKLGETGKKVRLIYPYPLAVAIAKMYVLDCLEGDGNYPINGKPDSTLMWRTSLGNSGSAEVLRHLRTLALVAPDATSRFCEENDWLMVMLAADGNGFNVDETVRRGVNAVIAADAAAFDKQVGKFYSDEFWGRVRDGAPAQYASSLPDEMPREYILPLDASDSYVRTPGRKMLELKADFDSLVDKCRAFLVENEALLLSGTPETSKLGTGCSWVSCDASSRCVNTVRPGAVKMYESRGDDMISSLNARSKDDAANLAALWFLCLNSFLECSVDKSRISVGDDMTTEFLRVDYSADGAKGYLNRSLVWVAEVRPLGEEDVTTWASKPVAGIERAYTCIRRGSHRALLHVCVANAVHALSKLGVDRRYLSSPKSMGGCGVLAPTPDVFSYRRQGHLRVDANAGLEWGASIVKASFSPTLAVTDEESVKVSAARLEALIGSAAPASVRRQLSSKPVHVSTLKNFVLSDVTVAGSLVSVGTDSTFGCDTSFENRFSEASEVAAVRGKSTWAVLTDQDKNLLRKVEKRYKFSRGTAVSWISGKVTSNESTMHPELAWIRGALIAGRYRQLFKLKRYDAKTSSLALGAYAYWLGIQLQEAMSFLYSW